jgi:hypothetical protein
LAKSHVVQSSFLSGVIDSRAAARVETEAYNNALLYGENIELHHLGGARRRRGLVHRATLPGTLSLASTYSAATAPNGGTALHAYDDDDTTSLVTTAGVSTTDPYVVVHYDLGSDQTIKYADVIGIQSDLGTSTQFYIQYSTDNVTWMALGAALEAVDYQDPRSYRREASVPARYWRVAKVGGTDMSTAVITIDGFDLWIEDQTPSAVRVFPFEVSTEARYIVALTDRSATVLKDGVVVCVAPMPYSSADLAGVDAANDAEDMVLVHEDYPPWFFVRESDSNFQSTPVVFDNVPTYDYNDAQSPTPVSDVQVLTQTGTWTQGDTFQIELNGARSGAVVYAGDGTADAQAATALNIQKAVQSLYTVKGYTGVSCTRTGTGEYTVTLGGASADDYELMSTTVATGSGKHTVVKTADGTSRHEPVWSSTRGYPRTVTFFEGRLFFGGTKSRQQTLFGSTVAALLDFEQVEGLDDEALQVTLRGQNLNAINALYAGRSLQVFTSGGEFRYIKPPGTPVTPADAPVNQTQYGAAKIRPCAIDGATLFVQRNSKSIRDFKYNYEEDAFDSIGVSALAPHLLNDVVDLFVWNGSRSDEISMVFVVNGDGTVAVLNSRREANVQAWFNWTTDGLFKGGATVLEDLYFAVQRRINNADKVFIEQADSDAYTDCAKQATPASTTVTGLGHLNGALCRVRADGFVLENATPSAGQITIDRSSANVEVGLNFNPRLTPMPLQTTTNASAGTSNLMRKKRIVKVRVRVKDTLGLLMNGRVLEDRSLDVGRFDDAVRTPYSGALGTEETTNWTDGDLLVEFTQVDPVPMNILGIDVRIESNE